MFNYPDMTGSVEGTPPTPPPPKPAAPKDETAPAKPDPVAKKPIEPPVTPAGTPVPLETDRIPSPAERAILESLQKRRLELDARARELDMRESLLQAAEKRLEGRIAELKDLETKVDNAVQVRDEAEQARFKNLVTMYENMKAKDAAKVFDRLDLKILVGIATQINPRRMSDILAQMQPDAAERLTTELAARPALKDAPQTAADLPKIEGKPSPN
jgi:flagellar motility protein MotE (MotC chaperone)